MVLDDLDVTDDGLLVFAAFGLLVLLPFALWLTTVGLFSLGMVVVVFALGIVFVYLGVFLLRRAEARLVHGRA